MVVMVLFDLLVISTTLSSAKNANESLNFS